jgi:hypothetical protein
MLRLEGKSRAKCGSRGSRWKALDEECPTEYWKALSLQPITRAQQMSEKYWNMIKDQFDEHKLFNEFKHTHMIRNELGLSHRWGIIQKACNNFYGNLEQIRGRPKSGKNMEDQVNALKLVQLSY